MKRVRRRDLPPDVVVLLREDPDLLAVADAISATTIRPSRPGQRTRQLMAVAAATAVALAVAVALFLATSSPSGFDVKRAVAAVGSGSRVHLAATLQSASTSSVGESGVRISGVYSLRESGRSVVHLTGVNKLVAPNLPQVQAQIAAFAQHYQATLKSGHVMIAERTAKYFWLRLSINGLVYQVAVDRHTYRPFLVRVVPRGSKATVTLEISRFQLTA